MNGAAELVRGLQERTARALPAPLVEHADGWWLRHAPGCAWWVGTVLPHGDGDLPGRVGAAERFYTELGAEARFQISPGACPDGLDTLLAARGYGRRATMSLQVGVPPSGSTGARIDDRPTRAWFDTWSAVHGGDQTAEWDLLRRVRQPSAYASVVRDGEVIAVGRAVADAGWVGVFGMGTLPAARGTGQARQVLAALAGWAGADRMYLQVELGNIAAMRLYELMGFEELCAYHYRIRRRPH